MSNRKASRPPRLVDADLTLALKRDAYEERLSALQVELAQIQQAYFRSGLSAVVVFEGWDAAGKGGAIRRMAARLDPRGFKVWPIGAPRQYYLERHFLVRFMERLPPNGAIAAFDRSWYGRVLVERVEDLTPEHRWRAGYREIVEFERMLTDDGVRLVKLFFHITPDEQLARFEKRLRDPMKRWKLTPEDFRNRRRWQEYEVAVDEMFARTSTAYAPWTLVAAEDKRHARVAALGEVVARLRKGVDLSPPELDSDVLAEAAELFPSGRFRSPRAGSGGGT